MRVRTVALWGLAAAMVAASVPAPAIQDAPLLHPKQPSAKPAGATLLLLCDLACNWKLDGDTKGHIDAGASAKVKVELGQHLVVASTEDGLDQIKKLIEVKSTGQTLASIDLQPVRDARLKAQQEARDKADQDARDKEARDQQARDKIAQEARDKAARDEQQRELEAREQTPRGADAGVPWIDPATGLTWAKKDNNSDVTWQQASNYCKNLRLAGYSNWRLPTIDELQGIYDPNVNAGGLHARGNLQLSGWEWSSSPGDASGEALNFGFNVGKRRSNKLVYPYTIRALCVRHD